MEMTNNKDSVGKSWLTPIKLEHLKSILKMHLSITNAVLRKHSFYTQTYHYIDVTAGPGRYLVEGKEVTGSPLLFLEQAETLQIPYKADFIEQNWLDSWERKSFFLLKISLQEPLQTTYRFL